MIIKKLTHLNGRKGATLKWTKNTWDKAISAYQAN